MLQSLFKKSASKSEAMALYVEIVEKSRNPYFHSTMSIEDDLEGRFEVLTLHVYAALRRLKKIGKETDGFAQEVFDTFFQNMDDSLREMGVGDMSIGKKIRAMAEAFYGRVGAYEAALDANNLEQLSGAISRNVYSLEDGPFAHNVAVYLQDLTIAWDEISFEEMKNGKCPPISPEPVKQSIPQSGLAK